MNRGVRADIGNQAAAQCDIEYLRATANGEKRFVLLQGLFDQEKLRDPDRHLCRRPWLLFSQLRVIEVRMKIVAAGEHHAVAAFDHGLD